MYQPVNEPIDVLCSFCGNKIMPRLLRWHGRTLKVVSLNSLHTSKKGMTKLFHFSLSTETSVYRVSFNSDTLQWFLDEIYVE